MRITRQILGLAAASLFGLTATLSAQEITFTGVDAGCVKNGASCVPDGVTNLTVGGLTVFADGFNGTTVAHFLGLSTGLGRLNLNSTPFNYNNTQVFMTYQFSAPNAPNQTFGSFAVIGTVVTNQNGIAILWANDNLATAKTFSFTEVVGGHLYSGTAKFWLNDMSLKADGTDNRVNGNFRVDINGVPEPASLALFATGLVGMIPVVRYQRRKKA